LSERLRLSTQPIVPATSRTLVQPSTGTITSSGVSRPRTKSARAFADARHKGRSPRRPSIGSPVAAPLPAPSASANAAIPEMQRSAQRRLRADRAIGAADQLALS
jgi:hypothetical protein